MAQVLICFLFKEISISVHLILPYHSTLYTIIAFLEEPQISDIGNEVTLFDYSNKEDSEGVPIPDNPGALVFPKAVPTVPLIETSDEEYMADVMDILKDKPGMCLYSFKTFVIISTVLSFTHIWMFHLKLQMMVKHNGPIEMLMSMEEEQPCSKIGDRPQSDASETKQQVTDVTVVAQAFNTEGTMVISPGN